MKNLKLWLTNKWDSKFLIGLAGFIGFADASYLTALSYAGSIPPCKIVSGCEEVLTSAYAYVWGVPVSLFGAVYYGAILLLLGFYLSKPTQQVRTIICLLSLAGITATGYFLYLQAFVLEAWCAYCLISTATSSTIFLASLGLKTKEAN